jgi:hypothetical protein
LAELLCAEIGAGFAFALLEVALHDLGKGGVAIQPRVVAKTHIIERHVALVRPNLPDERTGEENEASTIALHDISVVERTPRAESTNVERAEHTQWWQPIVSMKFDDPDQQQPRLHWKNNTRTPMPWPGTWLTTYTWGGEDPDGGCGVALSGYDDALDKLWRSMRRERKEIQSELPDGSNVEAGRSARFEEAPTPLRRHRARGVLDDSQFEHR